MGKLAFLLIALLISSVATFVVRVECIDFFLPIFIRADGSIDPPTAPISTVDNVTYTLTDLISSDSDGIVVERDNIVIDGAGQTLQGNGNGVVLTERVNVTIKGLRIRGFASGVYLNNASFCSIYGNHITNNDAGVHLKYSSSNTIYGNNVTLCYRAGIELNSSSGNSVSGNNITYNYHGIWLYTSSNYNTITENDVATNDMEGIKLENCLNTDIANNDITDNDMAGIRLFASNSSLVSQNLIAKNYQAGTILDISYSNTICENDMRDNRANMVFEYSVNGGVALSSDNRIFHNNFINGTWNVIPHFAGQPENLWDDGYPSGGNYWSDYNGTDADQDGIGDTSYVIDTRNADNYPLMGAFHEFTVTDGMLYDIATVSNFTISDLYSLHELKLDGSWYLVLEFTALIPKGMVGFCRIDVPRALMNGPYRVFTLGGNFTPTELPISNSSHAFLYFTFDHSGPVMIVPEFPSFLILLIFFMATLLAATAYRRKRF